MPSLTAETAHAWRAAPHDQPSPLELVADIIDLLTDIKALVIAALEDNVDREKIQADIDGTVSMIQELAEVGGRPGFPLLSAITVEREAGRARAPGQIDIALNTADNLAAALWPRDMAETDPPLTKLDKAVMMVDLLDALKKTVVTAYSDSADRAKLQAEIEADLSQFQWLSDGYDYGGPGRLDRVDVTAGQHLDMFLNLIEAEQTNLMTRIANAPGVTVGISPADVFEFATEPNPAEVEPAALDPGLFDIL